MGQAARGDGPDCQGYQANQVRQKNRSRSFSFCAAKEDRPGRSRQQRARGGNRSRHGRDPAGQTRESQRMRWIEADALCLPFPDESFDLVTSAFGFRNLADYDAGLREILRVLRPGGESGILEFSEPRGLMGKIYNLYFKGVLPRVGRLISGSSGAYSYLPASVQRFPEPPELLD